MDIFIGIDGGGTKTKINIIDQDKNLIFENISGPSSIDTVDSETSFQNIYKAIKPFLTTNSNYELKAIFAGLGGIVFESDCTLVETYLKKLPMVKDNTLIVARNDMENALYSSLCFDEGISLICGTGTVAFGKKDNKTHKAGGWGFKEGELGSGFNLGIEAIRHTIRAFDSRHELDDFALETAEKIGLKQASDIINIMERYYENRTLTAKLAPIVTKHANLDNLYAKEICDRATTELALSIKAVYHKLMFDSVTVVIVGSLGNSIGYFHDKLVEKIKQINKEIKVIEPQIDPSLAAAYMAKKLYNQKIRKEG